VLTCNMRRANERRARELANWLVGVDADVLVLTEVSANESGRVLAAALGHEGYGVLLPEPSATDRYRVLLAARDTTPLGVDIGLDGLAHRAPAARVSLSGGELGIVGLYVPSRGPRARRNEYKRAFQDQLVMALPSVEKRLDVCGPVVIAGDLNVVEPAHEPRYAVFGRWEYDFYEAFDRAGLVDAFRVLEPVAMDYSWFGRPCGDGRRNGYRIDHIFLTGAYRDAVVDCHYDHSVRTRGLTDHSALILDLEFGKSPVAHQSVAAAQADPTAR
jgi:exodeoxyribonuclease III